MQIEVRGKLFWVMVCAVSLAAAWSCSEVTDAPANLSENRLRERSALVWSNFVKGNFEAYVAMWSARTRPSFRESEEDWQKTVRTWKSFLMEKPTFELLDLRITGQRARAKMRVSALEKDGSRSSNIQYDHWIFENGDWFLDDAGRTE